MGVAVAAQNIKYTTQMAYNGKGCKKDATTGATEITAMDMCINNRMVTMDKKSGNITVTQYTDGNCTTGKPTVVFSAPLNKCGNTLSGQNIAIFKTASRSFDQSCYLKYPPYAVVYKGSGCGSNAVIVSVAGQAQKCTTIGENSVQDMCTDGTTQQCTYTTPDCTGTSTCTQTGVANECGAYPGNDDLQIKMVCPGNGVANVCPAHKPDSGQTTPDVGGVVAGVLIVVVIVIVVIVLLLYFFVIKKQAKGTGDDGSWTDLKPHTDQLNCNRCRHFLQF